MEKQNNIARADGINLLIGIIIILGGVLINKGSIEWAIIPDGNLTDTKFIVPVYLFNILSVLTGSFLIYKRKNIDPVRYILPIVITFIVFTGSLELYARVYAKLKKHLIPNHITIKKQEQFDKTGQLVAAQKNMKGLKYYDYHIYAHAPFSTDVMTFTPYFSARNTPDSYPHGKGDIIIWLFGGSTMENIYETVDKLTIANQLALNLNNNGMKSTVVNFGVGSFQSSLESIKFQDLLRRIKRDEWPDIAVFYDGFNDAGHAFMFGPGNMQADISDKLNALVTRDNKTLLLYSFSNLMDNLMNKRFYFWNHFLSGWIKSLTPFRGHIDSGDNLMKAVEIYELNTIMIRGVCKQFDIKPVFILQPMIYTKANHTEFEKKIYTSFKKNEYRGRKMAFMERFHETARKKMEQYDDFYDLSDILNNSKKNDFYDYGHTGPYTGIDIGYNIYEIISKISQPDN